MEYKKIAYYGIQAIKYIAVATGVALAIEGFIDKNSDKMFIGGGSLSAISLFLTSGKIKKVLGIKDINYKTLDNKFN